MKPINTSTQPPDSNNQMPPKPKPADKPPNKPPGFFAKGWQRQNNLVKGINERVNKILKRSEQNPENKLVAPNNAEVQAKAEDRLGFNPQQPSDVPAPVSSVDSAGSPPTPPGSGRSKGSSEQSPKPTQDELDTAAATKNSELEIKKDFDAAFSEKPANLNTLGEKVKPAAAGVPVVGEIKPAVAGVPVVGEVKPGKPSLVKKAFKAATNSYDKVNDFFAKNPGTVFLVPLVGEKAVQANDLVNPEDKEKRETWFKQTFSFLRKPKYKKAAQKKAEEEATAVADNAEIWGTYLDEASLQAKPNIYGKWFRWSRKPKSEKEAQKKGEELEMPEKEKTAETFTVPTGSTPLNEASSSQAQSSNYGKQGEVNSESQDSGAA